MNRTKSLIISGLLAGLALAPAASAQDLDVAWMDSGTQIFSVHAGGQFFDIGDQLDVLGTDIQTELNLGARYQLAFTEHLGFEADVTYSPSNLDFVGPGLGANDVNVLYYTGNLVYNILPSASVIPYLTGGVGGVSLFLDDGLTVDSNSETKLVGNFGGGLLFPVTDRFGLRFDARNYVYRLDDLDLGLANELSFPSGFEETVNDVSISAALSFTF